MCPLLPFFISFSNHPIYPQIRPEWPLRLYLSTHIGNPPLKLPVLMEYRYKTVLRDNLHNVFLTLERKITIRIRRRIHHFPSPKVIVCDWATQLKIRHSANSTRLTLLGIVFQEQARSRGRGRGSSPPSPLPPSRSFGGCGENNFTRRYHDCDGSTPKVRWISRVYVLKPIALMFWLPSQSPCHLKLPNVYDVRREGWGRARVVSLGQFAEPPTASYSPEECVCNCRTEISTTCIWGVTCTSRIPGTGLEKEKAQIRSKSQWVLVVIFMT